MSQTQEEFDLGVEPFLRPIPADDMMFIVDESKQPCPCCHQSRTLNPHRIDKQKMRVLKDMINLHIDNEWVRVEAGRGLMGMDTHKWEATAYRAREHISRLQWFGLTETKFPRSSVWRVTPEGFRFARGIITVPLKILCRNGAVVYESSERIYAKDVTDNFGKEYWDNYPWSEVTKMRVPPVFEQSAVDEEDKQ